MVKARLGVGLVAGLMFVFGAAGPAAAAPTVDQMLQYRPRQAGVNVAMPAETEKAACEVKLVRGSKAGSSGWMLLDGRKRPMRRFFDKDGDKKIDTWSYYKNGLEVYREVDTNANNVPDQYRWLNTAGMKWGVDSDEDGKIESWRMISAEEAALEAYHAMMTRDLDRLKVLFVDEAELKQLGLPPQYVARIKEKLQKAPQKFQQVIQKIKKPDGTVPPRVESAAPQCVPGESIGVANDLFRYPTRTLLYPSGKDQFDILNTGEMLQVGLAWRLLDVPAGPGSVTPPGPGNGNNRALEEVAKHDSSMPSVTKPGPNQTVVDWNMKRVALIDQLLPSIQDTEREIWIKQKADNLQQAALHSADGDTKAFDMLRQYYDQVAQQQPKSNLAAYLTYRFMWAEFAPKLTGAEGKPGDLAKHQAQWLKELDKFVGDYPKAEDTPDALWQLAMGNEFTNKDAEAKRYYKQLADGFPKHPMAPKARGAVRRMDMEGKTFELNGPTMNGANFNMISQRGKAVVVYYWASYCTNCSETFGKLKKLKDSFAGKGFEIVTVNLDDQVEQARSFLQSNPLPGYHLFAAGKDGGMNSPLAVQYGVMGLPTAFLVGRDGTVISRNIQINDLEDAITKELK